ncbi:hypothetical protein V5T82_18145, partial [Magnetovibrio sp. PR-2]|uniref:hypothetical protein n=1 Tax=Magnetovibrio sp. PR-2 TaxID=3120356 RepID=UPI002FCE0839
MTVNEDHTQNGDRRVPSWYVWQDRIGILLDEIREGISYALAYLRGKNPSPEQCDENMDHEPDPIVSTDDQADARHQQPNG